MKKNKWIKSYLVIYEFSSESSNILKKFLKGEMTSREAGKKLNISHQGVINLSVKFIRSMIQKKKIKL